MHANYFDSAEGVVITRERGLKELRDHDIKDAREFDAELGARDHYDAQEVLSWLGY